MAHRRLAVPGAIAELPREGLGTVAETSGDTLEIEHRLGKFTVSIDAALTTAVSSSWKRFQGKLDKLEKAKNYNDPSRWPWLRIYSGDYAAHARGTYLQTLRVLGEPKLLKRRIPGVHFGLNKLAQIVSISMPMAIALTQLEQQGGEVAFVRLFDDPNHRNVGLVLVGAAGHGVGSVEAEAEAEQLRGGRAGKLRYAFLLQS